MSERNDFGQGITEAIEQVAQNPFGGGGPNFGVLGDDLLATIDQVLCLELPEVEPFILNLPGVEIGDVDIERIIQAALAPLMPFFRVIDVLAAVVNCVKAAVDAIGPPPDPVKLLNCVPELEKKLRALLALSPFLTLPLLVKQLLQLLISILQRVKRRMLNLIARLAAILAAMDRARDLGDLDLLEILVCAQSNILQEGANLAAQLASLGRLIALINIFIELAQIPIEPIPEFSDLLSGGITEKVLEPIDDAIKLLRTAEAAIPLP